MTHGTSVLNMSPNQDLNICSIFWTLNFLAHLPLPWSKWTQNSTSFTSKVSLNAFPFSPSSWPRVGSRPYFHLLLPGLALQSPFPYFQNYTLKHHITQVPCLLTSLSSPLSPGLNPVPQPGSVDPLPFGFCPQLPLAALSHSLTHFSLTHTKPVHHSVPQTTHGTGLENPPSPQPRSPGKFLLILQDLLNVTPSVSYPSSPGNDSCVF